jgi:clan AA aspartic protease (TIGR02281 family)
VFALLASLACSSCAVTEPVVVIGPNGDIFRGMTTAALSGGSFGVTNGKITCSGTYNALDLSPIITIPTKCSDGRTGVVTATREANGLSGMGSIAVSDGTNWRFGFGSDAAKVEQANYANASSSDTRPAPEPSESEKDYAVGASHSINMKREGGTYVVPVLINDAIKLDFVVDSGASDVSIPADVVLTLVRTGTITDKDFMGKRNYQLADGSSLPSPIFRIRSLKVGDFVVLNVTASVAPVQGTLLLGQSFLGHFKSWSMDNSKHVLVLK